MIMASSFLILMFMRYITVKTSSWRLQPGLIRADDEIATGAFNDTIFLIGGYLNPRQITKYHINSQQFIDLGIDALGVDFNGGGQYWTQQQHTIYATNQSQFINVYNMETNEYFAVWKGGTTISDAGCLASTENYLFITGGADIGALQILSLSSFEWITHGPSMNTARRLHACITNNDHLFVFGGTGSTYSTKIDLNERIRITDIAQNTWNYVDPLTLKLTNLRAASLADSIYIVGGNAASDTDTFQSILHVMDANTGSIEVFPDALPLRNAWGSPIIVDGILFVMGGFYNGSVWDSGVTNNYAFYPLFTTSPTTIPTTMPSPLPTANPSAEPTVFPSAEPTVFPSAGPTLKPSSAPTAPPSSIPTASPLSTRTPSQSTTNDTPEAPHDVPVPHQSSTTAIIVAAAILCIILCIISVLICALCYIVPRYMANNKVTTMMPSVENVGEKPRAKQDGKPPPQDMLQMTTSQRPDKIIIVENNANLRKVKNEVVESVEAMRAIERANDTMEGMQVSHQQSIRVEAIESHQQPANDNDTDQDSSSSSEESDSDDLYVTHVTATGE